MINKKIINIDTIKNLEKNFLNSIHKEINEKEISKIIKEKYDVDCDIKYKDGKIMIYENKVAYKINCNLNMKFFVSFDQNGNVIKLSLKKTL